jgi:hypothetical protein
VIEHADVIRNVCIHTAGEQPLLVDLFFLPSSSDAGLLCTNLRSMDGKRPVFIDHTASTFFFPYHVIRFLEIPEQSMAAFRAGGGRIAASGVAPGEAHGADDVDAGLEDGVPAYGDESMLPIAVGPPGGGEDDTDLDLEIDEDFLQRVRDI